MESRYPTFLGHRRSNLYLKCIAFLIHRELLNFMTRTAHGPALHGTWIDVLSPWPR